MSSLAPMRAVLCKGGATQPRQLRSRCTCPTTPRGSTITCQRYCHQAKRPAALAALDGEEGEGQQALCSAGGGQGADGLQLDAAQEKRGVSGSCTPALARRRCTGGRRSAVRPCREALCPTTDRRPAASPRPCRPRLTPPERARDRRSVSGRGAHAAAGGAWGSPCCCNAQSLLSAVYTRAPCALCRMRNGPERWWAGRLKRCLEGGGRVRGEERRHRPQTREREGQGGVHLQMPARLRR